MGGAYVSRVASGDGAAEDRTIKAVIQHIRRGINRILRCRAMNEAKNGCKTKEGIISGYMCFGSTKV